MSDTNKAAELVNEFDDSEMMQFVVALDSDARESLFDALSSQVGDDDE